MFEPMDPEDSNPESNSDSMTQDEPVNEESPFNESDLNVQRECLELFSSTDYIMVTKQFDP